MLQRFAQYPLSRKYRTFLTSHVVQVKVNVGSHLKKPSMFEGIHLGSEELVSHCWVRGLVSQRLEECVLGICLTKCAWILTSGGCGHREMGSYQVGMSI